MFGKYLTDKVLQCVTSQNDKTWQIINTSKSYSAIQDDPVTVNDCQHEKIHTRFKNGIIYAFIPDSLRPS